MTRDKAEIRNAIATEKDYDFVEQPSKDFFCPIMYGLLLQPHQTDCCGGLFSEEAVTRIQGERGACPLCKEPSWNTMLDKRFRRQVYALRVFCRHKERGCGWEGELSVFEQHVESCPKKCFSMADETDRSHGHEATKAPDRKKSMPVSRIH